MLLVIRQLRIDVPPKANFIISKKITYRNSLVFLGKRKKKNMAQYHNLQSGLPTCTDFRGTYRFWPSITISRFHAVVYRFWKMREFLGLADFVLFCFRRYSVILSASCTYRQSRRCVAAINSPPHAMNQC